MSHEQSSGSGSPSTLKNQHQKLISYLDDFGKQISSRKSNNHTLQEQLSSLSKAYNNAQQKLLETEKALLQQSVLLQKQRTVIQIYKHILLQNMEDQGILGFIQNLEEDEEKRDIFEELEEIKGIINKKKLSAMKRSIEEDRTFKELKKEITRLHDERSNICDESEMINSQNCELKQQIQEMSKEKERIQQENQRNKLGKEKKERELAICQEELERTRKEIKRMEQCCGKIEKKDEELFTLKGELQEIQSLLNQKLSLSLISKENKQPNQKKSEPPPPKTSTRYFLSTIDSTLSTLLKYKTQYKKLKQNYHNNDFIKKELSLLKLFLSQEVLELVKEYEQKKLECLEEELRSLAMMERNKSSRLEDCQREVWKYKLQLMREEESNNIPNIYLTQSLRPNLLSSMEGLLESHRNQTQPQTKLIASTQQNQSISDFSAQQ